MVRFEDKEIAKEKFYAAKRPIKIWDVNVDNIVISKLVKTKTNSKYLIGYLDKAIRSLVLIMPEMSGYVKTFKVKACLLFFTIFKRKCIFSLFRTKYIEKKFNLQLLFLPLVS